MDYIEGETLGDYLNKPDWDIGKDILYDTLIKLQQIDPIPLRKRYREANIPEKDYTWLCQYTDLASSNVEWNNPAIEWITDNKPQFKHAICHGDYHPNNIIIENGEVRGVVDWVNVCIDDPMRDFAATYVSMTMFGPRMFPDRAAEIKYRLDYGLEYYRDRVVWDEFRFHYYQAFKCLIIMLAYEFGVEFYGRFGIIDAIVHLFNELTGTTIHLK
jgi:aminoglycoside phosphotransferase (APT) family kinase protein